jgi:MtN3 and saliva related transmembrane protein
MDYVTLIGLGAACGTTISFIPQAIQTIKTKNTSDISLAMYGLFTTGTFLWFLYGLLTKNFPVVLANGITLIFASIILVYKIRYK